MEILLTVLAIAGAFVFVTWILVVSVRTTIRMILGSKAQDQSLKDLEF